MNLRPEQLQQRLRQGLAPLYLLAGDEFLLVQEAADAIRARARDDGYGERRVLHADAGFDWRHFASAGDNLSLFSERRLLELRLDSGRPGDAGATALRRWASRPPPDTVLLMLAGALDRKGRASAWYRDLERSGVCVYAWPVRDDRLPAWIEARMRGRALRPSADAIAALAERTEGNLLACAQEIDKLALLYPEGDVDVDAVVGAVADSARFDVFDLPDRVLAGAGRDAVRRLSRLREEGVEPALVLWSLARDLRVLARAAALAARGVAPAQALARAGVWKSRMGPFTQALRRTDADEAAQLLCVAARVDRVVKGAGHGRPWEELLTLCVQAAGLRWPAAIARTERV